jgi:hypothetical protein
LSPLRITWVLPFLDLTGGIRVVYEHTRELLARGHQVTLVAPERRPGAPWTAAGRAATRAWLIERLVLPPDEALRFYGLAGHVRRVRALEPDLLPDGEIVLATGWPTADAVAAAPERCGRHACFFQHYEVFEPGMQPRIDAIWRLPFERIVIASWMLRLAHERFGVPAWGPVVNGVNLDLFRPEGRRSNDPPVVGMLYELQGWKGLEDGLAAVAMARREVPDLRLLLFGRYRLRHALRPGDRYRRNPPQRELAALYRECDLFLSPSWTEGCQLPPMEAMASGCAVVATEVGGVPDYSIPGTTLLAAPPHRPELLAAHLVRLARDRGLRTRLAEAGRAHIQRFTWQEASGRLEGILAAIARGETAPVPPGPAPQALP